MARKIVIKAVVVLLVLAGLGWLFLRTIRQTNAEPYTVDGADLAGWTLAVAGADAGGTAVVVLQPPIGLPAELFRQIFLRSGQSMAGPARAAMPVILRSEYGMEAASVLPLPELLDAVRAAGVEQERLDPICLAVQQDLTRAPASQRYFVVFSSTAFVRAREGVGRLLATREAKTAFDPAALRPVLPVAATEADFDRWVWPLRVDTSTECQAPLEIAP